MPEVGDILSSLEEIARTEFWFAVGWHVLLAAVVVLAIVTRTRPTCRDVAYSTCLPLASVAVFTWLHGSVFNGLVFSVLAGVMTGLAGRAPANLVSDPTQRTAFPGAALVAFAWTYPHFLETTRAPGAYFFGAPVGLLPCPTLALVCGVLLVTQPSRAFAWIIGCTSIFYGGFGALKLGVWMDLVLLGGGIALLASTGTQAVHARGPSAHNSRNV